MIPTLTGDIPGLLRLGTVCHSPRGRCVVLFLEQPRVVDGPLLVDGVVVVSLASGIIEWLPLIGIVLDLSDPTGRVHAAWWLEAQGHDEMAHAAHVVAGGVIGLAQLMMNIGAGLDVSAEQIGALRAVVLRVAGLNDNKEESR